MVKNKVNVLHKNHEIKTQNFSKSYTQHFLDWEGIMWE